MDHKKYEVYLGKLQTEMTRFKNEFTAKFQAKKPAEDKDADLYGLEKIDEIEMQQGGLISDLYIQSVDQLSSGTAGRDYIRNRFFIDAECFRGAVCPGKVEDAQVLEMFKNYNGMGSAYRPILETRAEATSLKKIPNTVVGQTLEDYNKLIAQAYLIQRRAIVGAGKNFVDIVKRDRELGRSGIDILLELGAGGYTDTLTDMLYGHKVGMRDSPRSTFASTTFNKSVAYGFSFPDSNNSLEKYTGVIFKAKIPENGTLAWFTTKAKEVVDKRRKTTLIKGPHDINAISGNDWSGQAAQGFSELLVPGGIDPRSISKVSIYDYPNPEFKEYGKNYKYPALEANLEVVDGQERVVITNYRTSKEGEKTTYALNKQTGEFEVVKEEPPTLAEAA